MIKFHRFQKQLFIVHVDDNEIRYDFNVDFHAHFKCTVCKSIYDIQVPRKDYALPQVLDGHKITNHELILNGTCKNCL